MSPAAKPDVVKVSGPSDLIAAVPHLLGFVPSESVVILGLAGRKGRITFTMRLDLVDDEHDELVAAHLAGRLANERVDAAAVFVFTAEPPRDGWLPRRALVHALDDELAVPVTDAVLVVDGRFWSYFCDDLDCCPLDGIEVDRGSAGAVAMAAAHALHGRAVLASREELVQSVAPIGGVAARSMSQALARASQRLARRGRVAATANLDELLTRYDDGPASLDHDAAADFIVACNRREFRESVALRIARHPDDDALQALFRDVARLAQPPFDAGVCTLLALAAYLQGDGVIADATLERALDSDRDHSFALLLRRALDGQVHPKALAAALRASE